jgi:hypothetical protein
MRKQTQKTYMKHEPSYKQPEVKTNRIFFYPEIVTDITTRNEERKDTLLSNIIKKVGRTC